MKFNENSLKGKWVEIKGDLRKTWGKLNDDELEQTKGDLKAIQGLIQQRYGETQDNYGKKIAEIFGKFEKQKDKAVSAAKKNLK